MRLSMDRRNFLKVGAAAGAAAFSGWNNAFAASPLIMQASWVNDAEFSGYFVAIQNGYYKNAGLDLNYLPGGPDVIPESTLVAGKADLALTTPDTTVQAIVDQGAKFKIIGTQYQKNPLGIVSLASKPVKTPQDMIGKTIAVPSVNVTSVEAVLKIANIDKSKVKIVPYEYDPTPLIKGEIDASLDFVTNVPYTIKQSGPEAVSFLLYDYGFTIFNDTVVVTEDTLKNKRKELVAWLKASRQGWAENLKDPKVYPPKLADSFFKGNGRTIDNEIFFNDAQKALIDTPKGIFSMSEEDIEKNIAALGAVGIKATKDMFDTSLLAEVG